GLTMFKNMKIGLRLGLGFGLLVALMLTIAVIGITRLAGLNAEVDVLAHDRYPKTVWANTIIDSVNLVARATRNVLLTDDPRVIKEERDRVEAARKVIGENLAQLEKTVRSEKGKALLRDMVENRGKYVDAVYTLLDMAAAGQREQATTYLLTEVRDKQSAYLAAIGRLIEFQNGQMEQS